TGAEINVSTFPRPIQPQVPIWITCGGSEETFRRAGENEYPILTNMLTQDYVTLAKRIGAYRASLKASRSEGKGRVVVMLHTFLGQDAEAVERAVKRPFMDYLRESAELFVPQEMRHEYKTLSPKVVDQMLEIAFRRYFGKASLMGTVAQCE